MASVLSILLLAIASTMSAARRGGHELQTDDDYESTMQGETQQNRNIFSSHSTNPQLGCLRMATD